MKRFACIILAVAAVALTACSSTPQTADDGDVRVKVSTAALKSDVMRVVVTVSGGTIPAPGIDFTLQKISNTEYSALLTSLPAGQPLTFLARAYGLKGGVPDTLLYSGSGTATPIANRTISLVIFLNELDPNPFTNNAPVITSLFASSDTVGPGETVTLRVDASDPDDDPIGYSWAASGGTFDTPPGTGAAQAVWRAPIVTEDTTFTITVTVSDDRGGMTIATIVITVSPAAVTGDVSISAIVNDAPRVNAMTVTPRTAESRVFDLTASATDAESLANVLLYSWEIVPTPAAGTVYPATDACAGSLDTTIGTAVTFTPGVPDGTPCTLRVTVTDPDEGQNTGTVSFFVGSPPATYPHPLPTFIAAGYGPRLPQLGELVAFSVTFTATPPVAVTWSTDFSTDTHATEYPGGMGQITDEWQVAMPATCPAPGTNAVIRATATNLTPAALSSTYTFQVSLLDPSTQLPCP
jgi:hypothetical protein